ncbi:gem-associated protein 6 [Stigmatopora argus]
MASGYSEDDSAVTPALASGCSDDWPSLGPLQWSAYVNNELRVTASGKVFGGWLLTVDPVSASLVLVTLGATEHEPNGLCVVMGAAVRRVEKIREADEAAASRLRGLFATSATASESACGGADPGRRAGLRRWLESQHVPVEERGDGLLVAGALLVTPPYGPDDCDCGGGNPIILGRVRELLQRYYAREDSPSHSPTSVK